MVTEPRPDDAIRTEEQPPPGTEVERLVHALEHIGKLLDAATARAVAAEARAERAEADAYTAREAAAVKEGQRRAAEVDAREARARVAAVEALAADDFTDPDEDGDRCERLLHPRAIRAALAAAVPPREDEAKCEHGETEAHPWAVYTTQGPNTYLSADGDCPGPAASPVSPPKDER